MGSIGGSRVFACRERSGVARPGQWLPGRDVRYWFHWRGSVVWVQWQPHRGLFPLAKHRYEGGGLVLVEEFPSLWSRALKKFTVGVEQGKPLPPLSAESKVLAKLPRLRAFLTDTQYEDGSPRAPGRLWLDQDGVGFTITLFEPSAFARVRLRAATLDDVFALCDVHLGAENAPWEVDQYARDRAAGKKKK